MYLQNEFTNHKYLIYIYKQGLELNNQLWSIYHKTKPNQTKKNLVKKLTKKINVKCLF